MTAAGRDDARSPLMSGLVDVREYGARADALLVNARYDNCPCSDSDNEDGGSRGRGRGDGGGGGSSSSSGSDSDGESDVQEGVRRIEAVSRTWSKWGLVIAYMRFGHSPPSLFCRVVAGKIDRPWPDRG